MTKSNRPRLDDKIIAKPELAPTPRVTDRATKTTIT